MKAISKILLIIMLITGALNLYGREGVSDYNPENDDEILKIIDSYSNDDFSVSNTKTKKTAAKKK